MNGLPYPSHETALLVIDPYNDFMSEGGKLYEATRETAAAVGFHANMRRLIPAVRAAAIRVIIVPHRRWRPGDYEGWTYMNTSQAGVQKLQLFAMGTWGGEFHPDFGPQTGDLVVHEHWAQSGFANTDLDAHLKLRGIRRIILVGTIPASSPRRALEWNWAITSP